VRGDRAGHAAKQAPGQAGAAAVAEDDHAGVLLVGELDDALPGRRRLDCPALGSKPGRFGQRGSVPVGPLSGPLDPGGLRRVELGLARRYESDRERFPNREDERVAPAGQLAPFKLRWRRPPKYMEAASVRY
jgi:hypothetical protein